MKLGFVLMMGALCGLREQFNGDGGDGGGGTMSTQEFQTKVLDTTKKTGERIVQLSDAQKAYEASNKKLLEDLQELQTKADGSAESMKAMQQKIDKIALNQAAVRKLGIVNTVKDICDCEEKKTLINAMIRKSIGAPLSAEHEKALDGSTTPGSTYLDDQLMTDIYDTLSNYGVWSTFDVRTVNKRNNKFLVKTARPIAKVFGEGITITEDTAKAGVSVTHEAKGIKVLLSVPNELMEDSEVDLSEDIMTDFLEAVAYRMDFMCLQADGTNDDLNGGQVGIFEGGTAATAAAGNTSMETLELEDVTNCLLAADEAVMGRQACWWIHPHILVRFLHIKDANGRPIFLTATEAPAPGAIGSLLGFPVKLSAAAPSANTPGSKVAAFGDPAGMVAGLRKLFEFKSSQEAGFSDDETVFRGVARFGNRIRSAAAFAVLTLANA